MPIAALPMLSWQWTLLTGQRPRTITADDVVQIRSMYSLPTVKSRPISKRTSLPDCSNDIQSWSQQYDNEYTLPSSNRRNAPGSPPGKARGLPLRKFYRKLRAEFAPLQQVDDLFFHDWRLLILTSISINFLNAYEVYKIQKKGSEVNFLFFYFLRLLFLLLFFLFLWFLMPAKSFV